MNTFPLQSFKQHLLCLGVILCVSSVDAAQVNSGSNGSDGAFNPTNSTVINMADHPDGIYQYTSVNIPVGVKVSFLPNAGNKPVVWLVQGNCAISGVIYVNGQNAQSGAGGRGGPGGFAGGNGGGGGASASDGLGPGGGRVTANQNFLAGNASFATLGNRNPAFTSFGTQIMQQDPPGDVYGNQFLFPLIGGSGGAGFMSGTGGGGGGGAFMVVASNEITLNGSIEATGGSSDENLRSAGGGSGGGVRLVATTLRGSGAIAASGGFSYNYYNGNIASAAGAGRVRLDAINNNFIGSISGQATRGFQPIILLPPNQDISLSIQSVGGVPVSQNPTGASLTPDVIVPGHQANPVSVLIRCQNIPLNTEIIVEIKPANGPTMRVVGANNTGTQASSTATVSVNMPRGQGTIQAKAISGIAGSLGASLNNQEKFRHYAKTGLTAYGEPFAKMEIIATLGGSQEIAYITDSGKRFVVPRN